MVRSFAAAAGTALALAVTVGWIGAGGAGRGPDHGQPDRAIAGHGPGPRAGLSNAAAPSRSANASLPAGVFDWGGGGLQPDLGTQGLSGIVVDIDTHRVLWHRDAVSRRAPASLTKMVTAMVAADYAATTAEGLGHLVTVTAAVADHPDDWTVMGLEAGEQLTVRDLVAGLFVVSGNDAAEALAGGLGSSRAEFVAAMNAKIAALGLSATRFANPTGLDSAGQYSTAYDLAVIATHLVDDYPNVAALAALPALDVPATATHRAYTQRTINGMVLHYPGARGLKTGNTDAAGGCLVSLVVQDGHRLLSVDLHSDIFVTDSMRLMDYGFSLLRPASPPTVRAPVP